MESPWSACGLCGSFVIPDAGPQRGPAVLIIAGSGPTDRDGNGPGLQTNLYRDIADGLASAGIRSLRYDKRGVGESQALVARESEIVFDDFVNDAVAAIRDISARPDISGIVLAGHSEGALVAIMTAVKLAAAKIPVAGLVLVAPPGRPMHAILRDQLGALLPPALQEQTFRILDAITAGNRVADIPPELMPLFRPSVQPFLISTSAIDPAAQLRALDLPVLIIQGQRDLQLGKDDADTLHRARPDATFVSLPQANHVMKIAPEDRAGNIATYSDPSSVLDPGLLAPIIDFVRAAIR